MRALFVLLGMLPLTIVAAETRYLSCRDLELQKAPQLTSIEQGHFDRLSQELEQARSRTRELAQRELRDKILSASYEKRIRWEQVLKDKVEASATSLEVRTRLSTILRATQESFNRIISWDKIVKCTAREIRFGTGADELFEIWEALLSNLTDSEIIQSDLSHLQAITVAPELQNYAIENHANWTITCLRWNKEITRLFSLYEKGLRRMFFREIIPHTEESSVAGRSPNYIDRKFIRFLNTSGDRLEFVFHWYNARIAFRYSDREYVSMNAADFLPRGRYPNGESTQRNINFIVRTWLAHEPSSQHLQVFSNIDFFSQDLQPNMLHRTIPRLYAVALELSDDIYNIPELAHITYPRAHPVSLYRSERLTSLIK